MMTMISPPGEQTLNDRYEYVESPVAVTGSPLANAAVDLPEKDHPARHVVKSDPHNDRYGRAVAGTTATVNGRRRPRRSESNWKRISPRIAVQMRASLPSAWGDVA
jgi:hypothetical protein